MSQHFVINFIFSYGSLDLIVYNFILIYKKLYLNSCKNIVIATKCYNIFSIPLFLVKMDLV